MRIVSHKKRRDPGGSRLVPSDRQAVLELWSFIHDPRLRRRQAHLLPMPGDRFHDRAFRLEIRIRIDEDGFPWPRSFAAPRYLDEVPDLWRLRVIEAEGEVHAAGEDHFRFDAIDTPQISQCSHCVTSLFVRARDACTGRITGRIMSCFCQKSSIVLGCRHVRHLPHAPQ